MATNGWVREVEGRASPEWDRGVPICQERCIYHDGKRCELLGLRAPTVCEPVVAHMSEMLDAAGSGKDGGR